MSEFVPSQLTLFEDLPLQVVVDSSEFVELAPINSIQNSKIIEFRDLGQPNVFKALDKIYLLAEVQIIKSDGKIYTDAENQGYLANNTLGSMIKSASLNINNVPIVNFSETFAQKDYIENVLNYDEITCKNKFMAQGLYPIENEIEFSKKQTKNSKICQFYSKFNLCNVDKWLLPNCDIYIKLELANQEFYLIEEEIKPNEFTNSKVVIKNLKLFIKYIRMRENFILFLEKQLGSGRKGIYEFKSSMILTHTIPQASTSFSLPSLYLGVKPSLAIICFVKTSSFLGDLKENPHKYELGDLTNFNFIFNGQNHPKTPYIFKNDETEQKVAQMFINLYKAIDLDASNSSCLVNFNNFSKQNFFIATDLTSCNYALSSVVEPFVNISLGFSAIFSKPTTSPITALLYILKPRRFEISAGRVVDAVY